MEDDQQFCLRWNNHQSTLVAVFDTLLENGTLVDCTLAAEGKYLNAHKVVLSACSPYFESLLSQNYDKHPIFILKDVKYQELKAMMDYMYRGEVNISQDQLGALLKAAESLQIKGLSDNRKGETETRKTVAPAAAPPPAKSPPPTTSIPRVQGLTIEQRRREMEESREGSQSPGARKKKRIRRRSLDDLVDNHHDASNSSESHHSSQTIPTQNIPATLPAAPSKIITDVPEPIESKSDILTRHKSTTEPEVPQVPIIKEKIETHSELMLEPKAEYIEEMNEDSIEDLTLDDDDISNMEQMDDQGAGPSHGNMGEGSGQGFGGWHMGNQSQDEVFLAAQEAVGAHRDSQDPKGVKDPKGSKDPKESKPPIRIIRIETLQKDNNLSKLKKDIGGHLILNTEDILKKKVIVVKQKSGHKIIRLVKSDSLATPTKKPASKPTSPTKPMVHVNKERMKLFLKMKAEDVPKEKKKMYACERDIKLFNKPKDTLRCTACDCLYETAKKQEHLKTCTKSVNKQRKYACMLCTFQHANIKEIEKHVEIVHKK